ncbi:MAG: hypothetical protein QM723_10615 [Myxococcaceae bacterium]
MSIAVLAVASVCACSSSPTCSAGRGGTGGGFGTTPTQVGLTGKPMNVEVQLVPALGSCSMSPTASRVDVAVAGPDNKVVMATATPPMDVNGSIRSTVTFTPAVAGRITSARASSPAWARYRKTCWWRSTRRPRRR